MSEKRLVTTSVLVTLMALTVELKTGTKEGQVCFETTFGPWRSKLLNALTRSSTPSDVPWQHLLTHPLRASGIHLTNAPASHHVKN
mmetsp:Transcript_15060/g.26855  ORF Transcript_15060/g.26855 Transcript_15060/m.26855 type:complete len:86 (-) Transcript_15060:197-454(-)